MNNSIIKFLSIIIFVLGGGVTATWYFSTSKFISHPFRDGLSISVLFIYLVVAGILIVAILIRTDSIKP